MDEVTKTKKEFRARQWVNIINDCKSSGMTIVSWCEKNNVR